MFRALRALVGSAFVLTAVTAASMGQAAAATKVVVEQFDGSGSANFRDQVKKALKDLDVDVITDKKLAATEADLGLMQASDSYTAVAKQLGASHFVRGTVKGKKPTATLVVKDSDGKKLGQKVFTGKNAAQLSAALDKQLKKALSELLGAGGGGGAAAVAVAEPKAEPKEEKKAAKSEAKEEKKAAKAEEREEEKQAAKAEKKEAADKADEDEDEDAEPTGVAAKASKAEEPEAPGVGWKGLDLAVGALIYSRDFTYNQKKAGDGQQYNTDPVAPAVALALDYFFTRNIGLSAGGEFTVGLSSARGNATFGTSSMGFFAGPKGKFHFGNLELNLLAAYAMHTFKLDEKATANGNDVFSNVPAAEYSMVRAVVGARYGLGPVALFGSFGYDHVLSMGAFTDTFPNATAAATEGSAGLAVPLAFLMSGLEVRAAFVARSYGISMNSKSDDANVAGGATDRYMGALITAGYRMN
ncbi:MAG: hypothetical protein SF187_06275 [Deltaproteobacteria bacterium]|nr:hypothetical protein [Deltaproteobacteria bacterium]